MNKGILTNVDMKMRRYRLLYLGMFLFMLVYCAAAFFPVIWILLSGFKDVKEMYAIPPALFPKQMDFAKLGRVWKEMEFHQYYFNTFVMSIGAMLFNIVISGFAGYALSRLKPVGTRLVVTLLFWIMLMPGTMRTVPLYMTFKEFPIFHFSMLDTYWPIWMMAVGVFDIILFKNFFDGISMSYIEAARIDGSSDIGIFFRIIMPLSVPVFMTVALFTFNGHFGQFFWQYLLISRKDMTVLGVQLFKMNTMPYTMDYQMLAVIFSVLPQVLIFALFQKWIIGGINIGGVKG